VIQAPSNTQLSQSTNFNEEVYVFTDKQSSNLGIGTNLREIYNEISIRDAITILKKHLSDDVIEIIEDEVNIRKLAAFILWFESLLGDIIHIVEIFPFPDFESEKLAFIEIDLDCEEKISLKLSKPIKAYMNSEGFNDISRKVALICQK